MITVAKPNKRHPFFLHFFFNKTNHFTTKTQHLKMEVEVKLRLKNSTSHQKLSTLLSPYLTKTLHQQNIFFDTKNSHLVSKLSALRLRFYGLDSRCILSLKSKPTLSFGISQVEEQEEPLDPILGREFVNNPSGLLSLKGSKIIERVIDEFGVNGEVGLVCLGGFKNVRQVFVWKGLKLELDESIYSFGTSYEIECETSEPERDKKVIEGFLSENGIEFSYSDVNKYAVFRSGKLPE